jgi:hypothetical protein
MKIIVLFLSPPIRWNVKVTAIDCTVRDPLQGVYYIYLEINNLFNKSKFLSFVSSSWMSAVLHVTRMVVSLLYFLTSGRLIATVARFS